MKLNEWGESEPSGDEMKGTPMEGKLMNEERKTECNDGWIEWWPKERDGSPAERSKAMPAGKSLREVKGIDSFRAINFINWLNGKKSIIL